MEEVRLERLEDIVAERKAQQVDIKRHYLVDPRAGEHRVTHAERSCAEARDAAAGTEWAARNLRAMKRLEPIAERVGKHDQVLDASLVGQRRSAARDRHS